MSSGDPNCLLSVLWGNGSSVALNDLRTDKEGRYLVSNDIIRSMLRVKKDDSRWRENVSNDKKARVIYSSQVLTYAHLAVSPREIAEAGNIDFSRWTASIYLEDERVLPLDEGRKIFDSIGKSSEQDSIMKKLRESQIYNGNTLQLRFEKTTQNVGPSEAMKRILNFPNSSDAGVFLVSGNMPLVCRRKKNLRLPKFSRTLFSRAYIALAKQRDLLECLRKDTKGHNLLPYMRDVFVMDWYSIIEIHLMKIFCSRYGDRQDGINFQPFSKPFDMYSEKIEQKMRRLFGFKKLKRPVECKKSMQWYDKWILDYKAELKQESENENETYKTIREEMIHRKYDSIRRRQRKRPPTVWLLENNLLQC